MKKSVNTILQNFEGKYLLQVRDSTAGICNPLKWNCFGGGMDDAEDPITASARETEEELGFRTEPKDLTVIGEIYQAEDRVVYVVRCSKTISWNDFQVNEGAGAGFFTKEEALKIDITVATRKIFEQFL